MASASWGILKHCGPTVVFEALKPWAQDSLILSWCISPMAAQGPPALQQGAVREPRCSWAFSGATRFNHLFLCLLLLPRLV